MPGRGGRFWFVTGTGTDVGKTIAGAALLRAAREAGLTLQALKAVATGDSTFLHDMGGYHGDTIVPDLLLLGKSLTGGIATLVAVAAREEIAGSRRWSGGCAVGSSHAVKFPGWPTSGY